MLNNRIGTMVLTARIGFAILAVFVGAIALTTFLNYAKFGTVLSGLVQTRFEVVGLNLKQSIEHGLSLGLPLDSIRNTQNVIDSAKSARPEILSIEVFDQAGRVRFDTDRSGEGQAVTRNWLRAQEGADSRHEVLWTAPDNEAVLVGVSLYNNFDKIVGGVALRYSRQYAQSLSASMLERLTMVALVVLAGTALIVGPLVYLVFRQLIRSFRKMERAASAVLEQGTAEGAAGETDTDIERRFAAFTERAAKALAEPASEGR